MYKNTYFVVYQKQTQTLKSLLFTSNFHQVLSATFRVCIYNILTMIAETIKMKIDINMI